MSCVLRPTRTVPGRTSCLKPVHSPHCYICCSLIGLVTDKAKKKKKKKLNPTNQFHFLSSMASVPHFHSDYHFSPDEFSEISSVMDQDHRYARTGSFSSTNMSSGAISSPSGGAKLGEHQDHSFPTFYDHKNCGALDIFQGESEIMSPIPATNSMPEIFGISDMVVPTWMDYKMGSNGGIAKIENFSCGFQISDVCEYGEDCDGFSPNFTPVICPAAEENWARTFFVRLLCMMIYRIFRKIFLLLNF